MKYCCNNSLFFLYLLLLLLVLYNHNCVQIVQPYKQAQQPWSFFFFFNSQAQILPQNCNYIFFLNFFLALKIQWCCQIQIPWPFSSCVCCVFLSFNRERKTGGMKLKSKEGKKPRRRHTDVSAGLLLQRPMGNFWNPSWLYALMVWKQAYIALLHPTYYINIPYQYFYCTRTCIDLNVDSPIQHSVQEMTRLWIISTPRMWWLDRYLDHI